MSTECLRACLHEFLASRCLLPYTRTPAHCQRSTPFIAGMKCGGCVGHVKKILESQPNVKQVTVNLATETALVRIMVSKKDKSSSGCQGLSPQVKAIADQLAQVSADTHLACRIGKKYTFHWGESAKKHMVLLLDSNGLTMVCAAPLNGIRYWDKRAI